MVTFIVIRKLVILGVDFDLGGGGKKATVAIDNGS